jgi:hypothetical protein
MLWYLLGYNAVQSFESQPTFRRIISHPLSESKNKSSKAFLSTCFQADFLFGLFFEPEDEGYIFLRNVS